VLIGIDPGVPKWSPLMLLVILFVTISFHAFFGVILTGQQTLLAPDFFQRIALPWLPDLMADQKRAGEIAWGTGELPTVILAFVVARQWFARDRAETVRKDRQADRDGDAELGAYNEMLAARRAQAEREDRRSAGHPVRRERG
jgi:putative copper resistance protein D